MRVIIIVVSIVITSCRCFDKTESQKSTLTIFTSYNETAFSIRIFEVSTDSTFRYWKSQFLKETDIRGYWQRLSDTFYLYQINNQDTVRYGKVFLMPTDSTDPLRPYFLWNKNDSALFDLTLPNARHALRYFDPPQKIDYKVIRKCANTD